MQFGMMFSNHFHIAALAEPLDPHEMVILGFLFVLTVLTSLAFLTWLVGKILHRPKPSHSPKVTAETDTLSLSDAAEDEAGGVGQVSEEDDTEDLRILAAISAAIHMVLKDQKFRVRSVRSTDPAWAQEGRRQIFSSHRLR